MGLFMSLSGVIGSNPDVVRDSITAFVESGQLKEQLRKRDKGTILGSNGGVTVLYPERFTLWDECTRFISSRLNVPAFSFHIHDGDLWMYILFSNGEQVDQFNPIPDYWEELLPDEKEKWKGNAEVVASLVPGLSGDSIEEYLVQWDLDDEEERKAYPDDEFPALDCWQLVDLIKKIGLQYPCDDQGKMQGERFHMSR